MVKGSFYVARIPVNRVGGCDGHVSVKWKTTDITAVNGRDYEGGEGLLEFDNQEVAKTIDIPIKDNDVCNHSLTQIKTSHIHLHFDSVNQKVFE